MQEPTTGPTIRRWLRCLPVVGREVLADWHLVPHGERTAECGFALAGPVGVAVVRWALPEPVCVRCLLWMRAHMARN